jgi:hypothetical protein
MDLINQKTEMTKNESANIIKIMMLESENTNLKMKLEDIMKDYKKRTDIITSLKNKLLFLNNSIEETQEQTASFKQKSE